ncbi:hypothetical protein J8273_0776 [Carpediemonas membranifera]|uniref:Uncharacterized protein n=1 Tax=Carpediemonas membranifera TaxID=201153 RepID=A0A8J6E520_9EUKA|nr:hypothetical protein J8273_0776 [Carpediemonas membranifera]|eukprot:KAG9397646.1 hypothetical protein J8273_0776 [Carpediemonas membranifera]
MKPVSVMFLMLLVVSVVCMPVDLLDVTCDKPIGLSPHAEMFGADTIRITASEVFGADTTSSTASGGPITTLVSFIFLFPLILFIICCPCATALFVVCCPCCTVFSIAYIIFFTILVGWLADQGL